MPPRPGDDGADDDRSHAASDAEEQPNAAAAPEADEEAGDAAMEDADAAAAGDDAEDEDEDEDEDEEDEEDEAGGEDEDGNASDGGSEKGAAAEGGAAGGDKDGDAAAGSQTSGKSRAKSAMTFPAARLKRVMRLDSGVRSVNTEAVAVADKAVTMFVEFLAKQSQKSSARAKRKTIQYRDVALTIKEIEALDFLQDIVPML